MSQDDIESAWLAGYLEGEGCFDMMGQTSPRIRITSTDLDVMIRAAKTLGSNRVVRVGRVTGGSKIAYYTSLNGPKAIEWMVRLYPMMGQRRKAKILECISCWEDRASWIGRKRQGYKRGPILSSPNTVWMNVEVA